MEIEYMLVDEGYLWPEAQSLSLETVYLRFNNSFWRSQVYKCNKVWNEKNVEAPFSFISS